MTGAVGDEQWLVLRGRKLRARHLLEKLLGQDYEIITAPADFEKVRAALAAKKITPDDAELTLLPTTTVKVEDPIDAQKVLRTIDELEGHEDIKTVYANFDIPDSVLAQSK